MKKNNIRKAGSLITALGIISGSLGLLAHAAGGPGRSLANAQADDATTIPGFSQYRLSSLRDEGEVKELYSYLRTDLTNDPWDVCSDRAQSWSYQLWKTRQVNSGKVFLFYTASEKVNPNNPSIRSVRANTGNPAGKSWIWHVAPYVVADGKMWVMEKFQYMNQPTLMQDWLSQQANGAQCQELTGSSEDMKVTEQLCTTRRSDGSCGVPGRMIRVPEGGPACYFRRVPMYYYYPSSVATFDHLKRPELTDWGKGSVYGGCYYSMGGTKRQRKNRCSTFVNNPMASFTTAWAPPPSFHATQNSESVMDSVNFSLNEFGQFIEPEKMPGALAP